MLPAAAFTDLLSSVQAKPAQFVPLTEHLWRDMDSGIGFSVVLRAPVTRFSGRLFAQAQTRRPASGAPGAACRARQPGRDGRPGRGFARAPRAQVAELLATLECLGHARRLDDGRWLPG